MERERRRRPLLLHTPHPRHPSSRRKESPSSCGGVRGGCNFLLNLIQRRRLKVGGRVREAGVRLLLYSQPQFTFPIHTLHSHRAFTLSIHTSPIRKASEAPILFPLPPPPSHSSFTSFMHTCGWTGDGAHPAFTPPFTPPFNAPFTPHNPSRCALSSKLPRLASRRLSSLTRSTRSPRRDPTKRRTRREGSRMSCSSACACFTQGPDGARESKCWCARRRGADKEWEKWRSH